MVKPAANGRCLMCKLLPCCVHVLYRTILSFCKCMDESCEILKIHPREKRPKQYLEKNTHSESESHIAYQRCNFFTVSHGDRTPSPSPPPPPPPFNFRSLYVRLVTTRLLQPTDPLAAAAVAKNKYSATQRGTLDGLFTNHVSRHSIQHYTLTYSRLGKREPLTVLGSHQRKGGTHP